MNGLLVVQSMKAVENVAIIGAGNMGSGIAQKSAQEGFNVQMVDREAQYVARGRSIIENFLQEAIERRIFSQDEVNATLGRITDVVGTENTAANTDLVIEAVFEDFDIKTAVLSKTFPRFSNAESVVFVMFQKRKKSSHYLKRMKMRLLVVQRTLLMQ